MNRDTGKILLVGDITRAFLDTALIEKAKQGCDICTTLPDASEVAKNNGYSAIVIVMSGLQTKLSSSIATLRDISSAKIILLAQMYEEPIAIRLMYSSYNGKPLIDDYMICPVVSYFELRCVCCVDKSDTQYAIHNTQYEELSTRIRHLEKMATEDDLTGLKNRRYIMEFTRQILEYAQKENGRVTLLVFDIDDFKKYNDQYGHIAGDEILKQAAYLMQRCCRAHDVVGRIGGDEFAVVFWDDPSILKTVIEQSKINDRRSIDSDHPHEAMLIAKRFVSELEKTPPIFTNQNKNGSETQNTRHGEGPCRSRTERRAGLGPDGIGTLTISGGLASYPRDGKTVQELFEQADKALLEAKRSGKNRIYLVGKPTSVNSIDPEN